MEYTLLRYYKYYSIIIKDCGKKGKWEVGTRRMNIVYLLKLSQ